MSDPIIIGQRSVVKLTDTSQSGSHTCVAICHEDEDGMIMFVPICTIVGAHENDCELNVGDTPEVKHPSYAAYQLLKYINRENLERMIENGDAAIGGPLADGVFKRLIDGFRSSDHVTPKTRKYFEKNVLPKR